MVFVLNSGLSTIKSQENIQNSITIHTKELSISNDNFDLVIIAPELFFNTIQPPQ